VFWVILLAHRVIFIERLLQDRRVVNNVNPNAKEHYLTAYFDDDKYDVIYRNAYVYAYDNIYGDIYCYTRDDNTYTNYY